MVNVTKVGFILEVRAENERDLGDKLYGYDDFEAERELLGFDPHNDDISDELIREEMAKNRYSMDDVMEIQQKQETVNDLLLEANFEGHGVLFKTDGTNLSGDGPREIPHFDHSATCDNYKECKNEDDENYYRLFSPAELILEGTAGTDILGDYKLRDDIVVKLTGIATNPTPGEDKTERM